jgi:DNA-binding phage protein
MKHHSCAFRTYVSSLTCDRCSKEVQGDEFEASDFLCIDQVAGYASPLGDGSRVELDLCPSCLKEVLGPWLRITDGPLVEKLNAFNTDRHGGEFPQEKVDLPLVQSRPHEESVVAALRSDPEFAAEYLNQVMHDGVASEIQLAVRRAAIAEILDPADARFLLRGMASLEEAKRTGGIPAEEVFAKLRAKGVAMREAISKKKS